MIKTKNHSMITFPLFINIYMGLDIYINIYIQYIILNTFRIYLYNFCLYNYFFVLKSSKRIINNISKPILLIV